jgi:uncharacterized membrane protein YfcA
LEFLDLGILCAVGLLTSMLSAVVGMAGGITLLSVMLLFFEPLVAIPIHGVVQLVSNSSRTYVQRTHVDWTILWRYSVMLVPMGFVGIEIAQALPPNVTRALIGVFVLIATWRRGWLLIGTHPERADVHRRFFILGGVVGLINMTIGAAGPLIAPFFLKIGLSRQAIIGTKAACQAVGHLVKIAIFGIAGFVFADYAKRALVHTALQGCTHAGRAPPRRLGGIGVARRALIRIFSAACQ